MSVNPEPVVDPYRAADRDDRIRMELRKQFDSIGDYRRAVRLWCLIEDAKRGQEVLMVMLGLLLGLVGLLAAPQLALYPDLHGGMAVVVRLAGFLVPIMVFFAINEFILRPHYKVKLQRFLDKLPEYQKGFEARVRQIMEDCE